ncbi:hypothetical protein niasHT_024562 [Heterodera trifolii]|uniref:Uncharacterized protein n=1 Tax=Heterodera trifolii TaxID=157864 RepID=A0ABD2K7D4_9BILA
MVAPAWGNGSKKEEWPRNGGHGLCQFAHGELGGVRRLLAPVPGSAMPWCRATQLQKNTRPLRRMRICKMFIFILYYLTRIFITETPKSSHHSTAIRTVPIDFEDERVSESPQLSPPPTVQIAMTQLNDSEFEQWHETEMDKTTRIFSVDFEDDSVVSESPQLSPPPTVPIPMGHLNNSEFEQWHETEMDEAMEGYCDAVKQYMDKYRCLAEEKKRLLSRIDVMKKHIFKLRAEFSEAKQQ